MDSAAKKGKVKKGKKTVRQEQKFGFTVNLDDEEPEIPMQKAKVDVEEQFKIIESVHKEIEREEPKVIVNNDLQVQKQGQAHQQMGRRDLIQKEHVEIVIDSKEIKVQQIAQYQQPKENNNNGQTSIKPKQMHIQKQQNIQDLSNLSKEDHQVLSNETSQQKIILMQKQLGQVIILSKNKQIQDQEQQLVSKIVIQKPLKKLNSKGDENKKQVTKNKNAKTKVKAVVLDFLKKKESQLQEEIVLKVQDNQYIANRQQLIKQETQIVKQQIPKTSQQTQQVINVQHFDNLTKVQVEEQIKNIQPLTIAIKEEQIVVPQNNERIIENNANQKLQIDAQSQKKVKLEQIVDEISQDVDIVQVNIKSSKTKKSKKSKQVKKGTKSVKQSLQILQNYSNILLETDVYIQEKIEMPVTTSNHVEKKNQLIQQQKLQMNLTVKNQQKKQEKQIENVVIEPIEQIKKVQENQEIKSKQKQIIQIDFQSNREEEGENKVISLNIPNQITPMVEQLPQKQSQQIIQPQEISINFVKSSSVKKERKKQHKQGKQTKKKPSLIQTLQFKLEEQQDIIQMQQNQPKQQIIKNQQIKQSIPQMQQIKSIMKENINVPTQLQLQTNVVRSDQKQIHSSQQELYDKFQEDIHYKQMTNTQIQKSHYQQLQLDEFVLKDSNQKTCSYDESPPHISAKEQKQVLNEQIRRQQRNGSGLNEQKMVVVQQAQQQDHLKQLKVEVESIEIDIVNINLPGNLKKSTKKASKTKNKGKSNQLKVKEMGFQILQKDQFNQNVVIQQQFVVLQDPGHSERQRQQKQQIVNDQSKNGAFVKYNQENPVTIVQHNKQVLNYQQLLPSVSTVQIFEGQKHDLASNEKEKDQIFFNKETIMNSEFQSKQNLKQSNNNLIAQIVIEGQKTIIKVQQNISHQERPTIKEKTTKKADQLQQLDIAQIKVTEIKKAIGKNVKKVAKKGVKEPKPKQVSVFAGSDIFTEISVEEQKDKQSKIVKNKQEEPFLVLVNKQKKQLVSQLKDNFQINDRYIQLQGSNVSSQKPEVEIIKKESHQLHLISKKTLAERNLQQIKSKTETEVKEIINQQNKKQLNNKVQSIITKKNTIFHELISLVRFQGDEDLAIMGQKLKMLEQDIRSRLLRHQSMQPFTKAIDLKESQSAKIYNRIIEQNMALRQQLRNLKHCDD